MANRYWIGGSGNWSDETHWSTSSGGNSPIIDRCLVQNASQSLSATRTMHGQSVTGNGANITDIIFKIKKTGTITGNAVVRIYAHAGTFGTSSVGTGAVLATSDNFDVSTLTTSFQDITFHFTGAQQIALGNGTKYVIVIYYTGCSVGNTLDMAYAGSGAHNGCVVYYDGGWAYYQFDDKYFIMRSVTASIVPTSSDAVILDASSGTGTLTIDSNISVVSINASATSLLTIVQHNTTTLAGNLTLKSGMTISSWDGLVTITAASTITTATNTINFSLVINAPSATVTLGDNYVSGIYNTILLTAGTLDTNNKNVTTREIYDDYTSNTRGLTLGTSIITLSGSEYSTPWDMGANANLTLSVGTSKITVTTKNPYFDAHNKTFYDLEFTGGGMVYLSQGLSCRNFTQTGINELCWLLISGNVTCSGTLTLTGYSVSSRISCRSAYLRFNYILSAAAVSLTNVDFTRVTASGAAIPFTGTSIGDSGKNLNITFTAPVTRYWVGNGGNWTDTAHWSASSGGATGATAPLPQDTVIFDSNSITSAGQTINITSKNLPGLDFTNILNSPTITFDTTNSNYINGNLKLKSGLTLTSESTIRITMLSDNSSSLFTAGFEISELYIVTGGTFTLLDNLGLDVSSGYLSIIQGTFDFNDKNVSVYTVDMDWSATADIYMGNGIWTVLGDNFYGPNSSYSTLHAEGSKIVMGVANASFYGDGYVYNELEVNGDGINIYGSNEFNLITLNTDGLPNGTGFGDGATNTIMKLVAPGASAGNLCKIKSAFSGNTATLKKKSSGRIVLDYMEIQDITVISETLPDVSLETFDTSPTVSGAMDEGTTQDWSNTDNVFSSNDVSASATMTVADIGNWSDEILASSFDFSMIPDDATILGIEIKVEAKIDNDSEVILCYPYVETDAVTGGNYNGPSTGSSLFTPTTSDVVYTFGGPTDKWGTTLTPAVVKNSNFGFGLDMIVDTTISASRTISIDHVTIKVYYSVPGAATANHWYAGAHSTNTSNNNGWIWRSPKVSRPLGNNALVFQE